MDIGLKDKVALVTGSSRGIGAATAKALAHHGATVIINYIQQEKSAREVLSAILDGGGKAIALQADARERDAVEKMVKRALDEFGRIDILVNNANISFAVKPFTDLTWDDIEAKVTGELKALYNCSQAVLGNMLERKSGKLIFVSSGLSRHPGYGFACHAAAKAAVDSMARVLAMELGPLGITVNVTGPGLTLTDATKGQPREMHERIAAMTPLRRIGLPDDMSGVVVFLASNLSDFITGEYIPVNGGSFMM